MMTKPRDSKRVLRGIALCVVVLPLWARDYLTLESTYLGGGLFEYTLTFPDDRYWDQVSFGSLAPGDFGDFTDFPKLPDGWTVALGQWQQDSTLPALTPYKAVFQAQTEQPAYQLGNATVTFTPHWRDWARPQDLASNPVTLYANLSCLVPAAALPPTGSPTNFVDRIPGFPEVQVQGLVFTNNQPAGLRFTAGLALPVTIQSSEDLKNWKTIGNAQGANAPVTWSSNGPLPTAKPTFYRVVVGQPL